ncbi:insulinase family protein [Neptunomonas phycophila]|uniref:insulinase family protein n=1 Tax=Neptunomonas phycophila TaxID=1572645 RepID=UPI001BE72D27|nr:insulinase family protein [Neptunomonas phycophila]MBT3144057.1 insulinase family protein [Neptunomonas phycophila]
MSARCARVKQPLGVIYTIAVVVLSLFISLPSQAAANLIKSPNDSRAYQVLTLPNQLEVLLISDPATSKAAVSMDVNIGSAANPKGREGLAHFLEHMLFLGTEKYPKAGEYQAFIQSHGGSHNAFTALENTNYFFDINANDLAPALDRFSQFFIHPLFSEEYTQRERNAVHSEYRAKIRDDNRRVYAATQQIMNPEHPASRFSVGNLETLNNENGQLRKDVVAFYNQYYSANQMKLAILGKQSLDQLAELAQQYFSAIPNKSTPEFTINTPLYDPSDLPIQINIQTLKDDYGLSLSFPMPSDRDYWETKPLSLISSMVGYEGDGSLLALLKSKGWANSLGASPGQSFDNESAFSVYIGLTPEGFNHKDEIVSLFFSYIASLKTQGISQALFNEEKLLSQQAFQFLDEREPIHYVTQLSQRMADQTYPIEDLLVAPYRLDRYDSDVIKRYITQITPENMVLALQANSLNSDQKAPNYNTPYQVIPLTSEQLATWSKAPTNPELFVRHTNPFIATDLSLKGATNESTQAQLVPTQLDTGVPGLALWHLHNTQFNVPKADVWFTLLSPVAREGADASVGLHLYTDLINEQLNKLLYDAQMAGLSTQIYSHARGISVRISGYDQQIGRLLTPVVSALRHPELSSERFNRVKQDLLQSLSNADKETPYNQLFSAGYDFLLHDPNLHEQTVAAQSYTLEKLSALIDRFYQSVEVRVLANGNLLAPQALNLTRTIKTQLSPVTLGEVAPDTSIVKIESEEQFTQAVPVKHKDHAVVQYLQAANATEKEAAAVTLINEIFSAPFYSQLRTEQQLGYIVFASPMTIRKQPGMALVVQSPSTDIQVIKERMDAFMQAFTQQLKELDETTLNRFKASVLARINDQDRQLSDSTNRFWRDIDNQALSFDKRERLSAYISALTAPELKSIYEEMITRRLILQTLSTDPDL